MSLNQTNRKMQKSERMRMRVKQQFRFNSKNHHVTNFHQKCNKIIERECCRSKMLQIVWRSERESRIFVLLLFLRLTSLLVERLSKLISLIFHKYWYVKSTLHFYSFRCAKTWFRVNDITLTWNQRNWRVEERREYLNAICDSDDNSTFVSTFIIFLQLKCC